MREAVAALTRTKMSVLESPTLYFPSETLTMGNCEGQEQQPRISRTCRHRGEASVGCGSPAVGSAGSRNPIIELVGHKHPHYGIGGAQTPL